MNRLIFTLAIVAASMALLASCKESDENSDPTLTPEAALATAPATPNIPGSTPPQGAPTATPVAGMSAGQAAELARERLASWLGPAGNLEATVVLDTRQVTWNNACLEAGRSGEVCAPDPVDGYRVRLELGNAEYEVRMDGAGSEVRWVAETQAMVAFVEATTHLTVFRTDDGSTLEAQPINGTAFGVRPEDLAEGEAVAVGLARAPQRDGWLLVWMDAGS